MLEITFRKNARRLLGIRAAEENRTKAQILEEGGYTRENFWAAINQKSPTLRTIVRVAAVGGLPEEEAWRLLVPREGHGNERG